jgi:hypothetical protein
VPFLGLFAIGNEYLVLEFDGYFEALVISHSVSPGHSPGH